jgi:hypothetical protein
MGKTERYVVSLLEQLLGPCERGKRFATLLKPRAGIPEPSEEASREARAGRAPTRPAGPRTAAPSLSPSDGTPGGNHLEGGDLAVEALNFLH